MYIRFCCVILILLLTSTGQAQSAWPHVKAVERQPLLAQLQRLVDAMEYLGAPLDQATTAKIKSLKQLEDDAQITAAAQKILDRFCLAGLTLKKRGTPEVVAGRMSGNRQAELIEQGWQTFLIKVKNPIGSTGRLRIGSPNSKPLPHSPAADVASRWMQIASYEGRPLNPSLSGLELEYRVVQIYSRDAGPKEGLLEFAISDSGPEGDILRRWSFDKDTDGWFKINQSTIEAKNGSLHVTSTGADPFIGTEVKSTPPGPMVLRFWAKSEVDGYGQVYWWTKEKPGPDGNRRVDFLIQPNKEALYEIPFETEGELIGVRLDPLTKPGKIRIDWIELCAASRLGKWSKLPIKFQCKPATEVTFRILDAYGKPGFAKFEIRDSHGQVFPTQSKRLAPDFFFHKQIYRGDKEKISLPAGTYEITCSRGPETLSETKKLVLGDKPTEFFYRIKRWIDPALDGWWSGDHHIHAAGCRHYENPTQGVMPEDMIRHIMGEDLKVGCCLTWGPCFDFQKRFFTGETAEQSRYPYTLRYDVEVSGFGSHMSGHLNLLNLQQQIYPGGESKDHWPTLGLNTLRWAKKQGAVCGPAHSAIGLTRYVGRLSDTEGKDGPFNLPNYNIPAFDGIGANEFIMNVTHKVPGPDGKPVRAIDFISAMNTERVAEWNMWYHVLNCGFNVVVSGETDFPCVSGERVGMGRVYAKVVGPLTFDNWVQALSDGRSYVSDGTCHLLEFKARETGKKDNAVLGGVDGSLLELKSSGKVTFAVDSAALLPGSKSVTAELIVNGYPVAKQEIKADGAMSEIQFEHQFPKSSWAAVRIFPHAHTNPIFVVVGDQPIRASLDSAKWCLAGVKECWKSKRPTYAEKELVDAEKAYDHAIRVFDKIVKESR